MNSIHTPGGAATATAATCTRRSVHRHDSDFSSLAWCREKRSTLSRRATRRACSCRSNERGRVLVTHPIRRTTEGGIRLACCCCRQRETRALRDPARSWISILDPLDINYTLKIMRTSRTHMRDFPRESLGRVFHAI